MHLFIRPVYQMNAVFSARINRYMQLAKMFIAVLFTCNVGSNSREKGKDP